jgi:hypothetical protein
LSLLLQNSNAFFQDQKSIVLITQVLDASCSVDYETCSSKISNIAAEIIKDENCGADFQAQNPLVAQAYQGLNAYPALYNAGCLKAGDGSYCYADAVTNASSTTDGYVYFLPLGVGLPASSKKPSCSSCLQQTMQVFQEDASSSSQSLHLDYHSAALQINAGKFNFTIITWRSRN